MFALILFFVCLYGISLDVIFIDFCSHVTYNFRFFYPIEFIWKYDCELDLIPKDTVCGQDSAYAPLPNYPSMAVGIAVVAQVLVP